MTDTDGDKGSEMQLFVFFKKKNVLRSLTRVWGRIANNAECGKKKNLNWHHLTLTNNKLIQSNVVLETGCVPILCCLPTPSFWVSTRRESSVPSPPPPAPPYPAAAAWPPGPPSPRRPADSCRSFYCAPPPPCPRYSGCIPSSTVSFRPRWWCSVFFLFFI